MGHIAPEDVGDGLDAAVGMSGESFAVILRVVRTKVVEHQEGIETGRLAETEDPPEVHTGPFDNGFGFDDRSDFSG